MDDTTKQLLYKAGKIASQVRREGAKRLAIPGTSFLETMDYCESKIKELGGQVAWAQMAVNEAAAHFCPTEDDTQVSQEGQLIKIDIGVHIDGNIADNAMTVQVATDKYNDLIKASQNALKSSLKLVEPGRQLWEIGEAQISEAEALGFTTVKNLCGHTVGKYKVHSGISIPSYNNKDKTELQEGWNIAIEPFTTTGDGWIEEKGSATIFMVQGNSPVRSPHARKILDFVKPFNGLPFTTRWLTREFGKGATALGLRELQRVGTVHAYPPLVERSKGMVAQTEHSIIVGDKKPYTRHDDDQW